MKGKITMKNPLLKSNFLEFWKIYIYIIYYTLKKINLQCSHKLKAILLEQFQLVTFVEKINVN